GEGIHEGWGTAHAEAVALDRIDAGGATLYTNLEPCNHTGKTPPCAPLLIQRGIVRVVAAVEDPDPRSRGSGFTHLRAHGVDVRTGLLAEEAIRLNAPYLHHRRTGRPLVTLKLALTLDGRMAARDGSARWITSETTRTMVHTARLRADAIVVGAGSVVHDDPQLTVRHIPAARQPRRVFVDATGRVSADAAVFGAGGQTIAAVTDRVPHEVRTAWKEAGAEVMVLPASARGVDLGALLDELGRAGCLDVLCEGGARLASSLLGEDLVDRLEIHYGPRIVGRGGPDLGDVGVRSLRDARAWNLIELQRSDGDIRATFEREHS
ncbi:MAG: bifunctional diaminohydroxyphosphoribosylaminopyrimidine deaminase/5-amino-6-(5-phosphoribosylamino)uracil reductase RibD, partial [Actinomycetota bacterium]|nr:bifunctional diaminohydroxyphosphoribosylaminopyrimidine deaminase/5-amino-6-(5-phosphoribosylamino)uracil reductase RibD [Actinomycetota bacterium]